MKWDGQRAIARCDETGCRLWSRNLREATDSYPDLAAALAETTADLGDGLLLDGEIVAPDPDTGAPSFARLQRRMHTRPTRALLDEIRVEFVVFDLLAVDGVSTMDQPYLARRELLDRLAVERGRVRVPPFWTDFDPSHLLDAAEQAGLEGVVAKRIDSVYRPGTRTRAWIKAPIRRSAEGIVAAWIEGTGAHAGAVGSLVLAAYDGPDLRYIGGVGTGFTAADRRALRDRFDEIAQPISMMVGAPRSVMTIARTVEPIYVVDVAYRELTGEGSLRHPSYRGLRPDRSALDITVPTR